MTLKTYAATQKAKAPVPKKPTPSGTACAEKKCKGEMLWREPREVHPEMPKMNRADCGVCGWMGWC